ncbi:hypothetical protein B5F74_11395 [Collinsella sp. An271]|nr:hypothetical protein B5F74_11395 [Collinsella sp. An271]
MRDETAGTSLPWDEVEEATYLYDRSTHYALYGPDLMVWHLCALDWVDKVYARDKRDRKAVRSVHRLLHRAYRDREAPS